jgi:hypothetical protein
MWLVRGILTDFFQCALIIRVVNGDEKQFYYTGRICEPTTMCAAIILMISERMNDDIVLNFFVQSKMVDDLNKVPTTRDKRSGDGDGKRCGNLSDQNDSGGGSRGVGGGIGVAVWQKTSSISVLSWNIMRKKTA